MIVNNIDDHKGSSRPNQFLKFKNGYIDTLKSIAIEKIIIKIKYTTGKIIIKPNDDFSFFIDSSLLKKDQAMQIMNGMQCSYMLIKSKYEDWPHGKNGAIEVQKTKNVIAKYVVNIILIFAETFILMKVNIKNGITKIKFDKVVK